MYQHIEHLLTRRGEKVAMFLTIEHMVGGGILAGATMLVTGEIHLLVRIVIGLAAFALGMVITTEMDGMALYERVFWRVRGLVRQTMRGRVLTAEQLAGVQTRSDHRAVREGGIARKVRQRAATTSAARPLVRSVATAAVRRAPTATPVPAPMTPAPVAATDTTGAA